MNWPDLILGAVLGMLIPYAWSKFKNAATAWADRHRWRTINDSLKRIDSLMGRLELVQAGWADGAFLEDEIRIALESAYQLPDDIRSSILEPSSASWLHQGFRDNTQCGVHALHIGRTTDDVMPSGLSHEIAITSHTYRYFECKATNFEWFNTNGSNDLLRRYAAGARHDAPASGFPTPLSVGLSLFCEGGVSLVLTHRTAMPGAGGHINPGLYFNAVGESCTLLDTLGELGGSTRLSIFRTATRGLLEEMGLDLRQVSEPTLHSLTWDPRMLDYKFFGYVICPLAEEEVRQLWRHAADKSENCDLRAVDVRT